MHRIRVLFAVSFLIVAGFLQAASAAADYTVGVGDELEINVLKPDVFIVNTTVAPDGNISFPYIGSVKVLGLSLSQAQDEIQKRLEDGYLKYPVLTVYLKEVKSKKYLVSGEVMKPGSYPLEGNITVLQAISIAGGFSKYGNASHVKVLRQKPGGKGYETVRVNVEQAREGDSEQDPLLHSGDMVVVSEGIF